MSFAQWVTDEAGIAREDVEHLHLESAFELLLCRCEAPGTTAHRTRCGRSPRRQLAGTRVSSRAGC